MNKFTTFLVSLLLMLHGLQASEKSTCHPNFATNNDEDFIMWGDIQLPDNAEVEINNKEVVAQKETLLPFDTYIKTCTHPWEHHFPNVSILADEKSKNHRPFKESSSTSSIITKSRKYRSQDASSSSHKTSKKTSSIESLTQPLQQLILSYIYPRTIDRLQYDIRSFCIAKQLANPINQDSCFKKTITKLLWNSRQETAGNKASQKYAQERKNVYMQIIEEIIAIEGCANLSAKEMSEIFEIKAQEILTTRPERTIYNALASKFNGNKIYKTKSLLPEQEDAKFSQRNKYLSRINKDFKTLNHEPYLDEIDTENLTNI